MFIYDEEQPTFSYKEVKSLLMEKQPQTRGTGKCLTGYKIEGFNRAVDVINQRIEKLLESANSTQE